MEYRPNIHRLENQIGFDRVRKNISDKCNTEYAVMRVENESFSNNEKEIRKRLLLTDEMRLIMMFESSFPTNGYIDTLPFLSILEKDGTRIDLLSLGKLRTMLATSDRIRSFFAELKDEIYPNLKKLSAGMGDFSRVEKEIDRIIDKKGEIKDTASDNLHEIRMQIKEKEGEVSKRLNRILKSAKSEGYSEESASVVVRDGKLLIPVNSTHKRKISGFVYDESASGKTTFIEPAEIVELGNELNELHFAEKREIVKILSEFSDFLRPFVPDLCTSAEIMGEFDFIMAKALTSLDYIAGVPLISSDGGISLRKARHPMLEKALKSEGKEMVPVSIFLTSDKHILLISGPNAGGKSVCLKTMGLLQYMFQWGMLIPTSETSEMKIFDKIMINIGDGQSIDNDLSTYSSFLIDMKEMLQHADEKTLVLIDEFGSGTEPAAGGAIAESILNELDKRNVYGVITTHYTNLKLYASNQKCGVINGAMRFDVKNISPLFQLDIGSPGNSFAFELARKMGLPESIVKDAETRAGEEYVGIERTLRKISRNKKELEEKLLKIKQTDKTLENITGKYQKELEEIQKLKKDILDQARSEAKEIVDSANKQVEKTIKTIKESQAEKQQTMKARQNLQSFVAAITKKKEDEEKNRNDYIEEKLSQISRQQQKLRSNRGSKKQDAQDLSKDEIIKKEPLRVGEKVRIKDNGMVGEVARVSSGKITVFIGDIISKIPAGQVERISSNEYKTATKNNVAAQSFQRIVEDDSIRERKLNFKSEIDVRGMRLMESLELVTRFIDDAIMLNVSPVRILHGKGTGVLREEIQKFLKTIPGIESVRDEHIQFGGTGVTVVTLH